MTCHRWPAEGCGTGWSTLLWGTATRCLHELQEMVVGEDTDVLAERIAERKGADANEWDRAPTFRCDAERNVLIGVARREDEECALSTHLGSGESLWEISAQRLREIGGRDQQGNTALEEETHDGSQKLEVMEIEGWVDGRVHRR